MLFQNATKRNPMRDATVPRSAATAKSATKKAIPAKKMNSVPSADVEIVSSSEQRHAMISKAAYFIAERSGFNPALSEECWLEAEKQIAVNFF